MCEVQLTTKTYRETKERKGHRDYEVVRELKAAVKDGAINRVKAILNFGNEHRSYQLNDANKKILRNDPRARVLLHIAPRFGLIEHGANIAVKDGDGNTPLHLANANGHGTTMWKLLHEDAKNQKESSTSVLDILNKQNSTPVAEAFLMLYQQPLEEWKRAAVMLFIDSSTDTLDTIDLPNGQEKYKWIGMARYKTKMFCAPWNATKVLILDTETNKIRYIYCGENGNFKWTDIKTVGTKLFCSPGESSSVLIIEGETEVIRKVDIGDTSPGKWYGMTALGANVICCPSNSSSVLVIDADSESTQMIECGHDGNDKWEGVTVVKDQLVLHHVIHHLY